MRGIRNFFIGLATIVVAGVAITSGGGGGGGGGSGGGVVVTPGGVVVNDGNDCTSPYNDEPNHAGTATWLPYINAYRQSQGLGSLAEESTTQSSNLAYQQLVYDSTNGVFTDIGPTGLTIGNQLANYFSANPGQGTFNAASDIFLKGCYGGNTVPEMLAVLEANPSANAILLNPNWNKFGAAMVPVGGSGGGALSRWGLVFSQITGE
jgi:hypothetical protein